MACAGGGLGQTTIQTGDLETADVRTIRVDDQELLVAWAGDASSRFQGLRGVSDLGGLDGMLFDLGTQSATSFTMRDTLIPLDIYFFDAGGSSVGTLEMVPCAEEPCPSYRIDRLFRYALEVPEGSQDFGSSPQLELP